ncbi:MAG: MBL fold metallo-hydrolase [Gammaproteobacteria bacterium]|nr:MBL fold metallo-hydrolase [Gammaproteobacteria bacterium]
MQLTFMGATGTVTGSKYLLASDSKKILIDCGLFQGYKELRLRNWSNLPIDPHKIDAVILTHAHIDHSGYLPLLVKNGFSGKIYCSSATRDLCEILLRDSGHLQEEEARFANEQGYSKHHPALPLYTQEDAERSLHFFHTVNFGLEYHLDDDLSFQLTRSGHILGSSFVRIKHHNRILLFSGDLGRPHDPVMNPPVIVQSTDYLVLEATYGNRLHEAINPIDQLGKVITKTAKRGGSVIIPAFAVGRAQSILYFIYQLKKTNKIPDIPVFLDSPMAVSATKIFCNYANEYKFSKQQCYDICAGATYTNTVEESKAIDNYQYPIIIISASGMATGGRVLHHLKQFAQDYRNTILFTGYQAGGTRGARMVNGESEVKIHGQMIPIRAEVIELSNTSAHADYQEILAWLKKITTPPIKTFITHGEPEAAQSLKNIIEKELAWDCEIPVYLQTEEL